MFTLLIADVFG